MFRTTGDQGAWRHSPAGLSAQEFAWIRRQHRSRQALSLASGLFGALAAAAVLAVAVYLSIEETPLLLLLFLPFAALLGFLGFLPLWQYRLRRHTLRHLAVFEHCGPYRRGLSSTGRYAHTIHQLGTLGFSLPAWWSDHVQEGREYRGRFCMAVDMDETLGDGIGHGSVPWALALEPLGAFSAASLPRLSVDRDVSLGFLKIGGALPLLAAGVSGMVAFIAFTLFSASEAPFLDCLRAGFRPEQSYAGIAQWAERPPALPVAVHFDQALRVTRLIDPERELWESWLLEVDGRLMERIEQNRLGAPWVASPRELLVAEFAKEAMALTHPASWEDFEPLADNPHYPGMKAWFLSEGRALLERAEAEEEDSFPFGSFGEFRSQADAAMNAFLLVETESARQAKEAFREAESRSAEQRIGAIIEEALALLPKIRSQGMGRSDYLYPLSVDGLLVERDGETVYLGVGAAALAQARLLAASASIWLVALTWFVAGVVRNRRILARLRAGLRQ